MKTVLPIAIWLICSSALFAQTDVAIVDAKITTSEKRVVSVTTTIDGVELPPIETIEPGKSSETVRKVGRIRAAIGSSVNAFDTDFAAATISNPVDGVWLIVKPGKYLVIVQSPNMPTVFRPLVVPGGVDPPDDPPPSDDVADLLELARENIPNDRTSVNALGSAWLSRLKSLPDSATLNDVRAAVGKVRSDALSLIRDPGTMGWNKFLLAVDVWFSSQPSDAMTKARYIAAMTALAELMVNHS